jgi:ubiquinol-cytochrome c reductase cytochrome b subunit
MSGHPEIRPTKNAGEWLDQRTGYKALVRGALFETIPGGARWRYVWGSTLVFALTVQFITGILLWAAYSANAQGAWESVYYIQYEMWGGWMLRGIHHFMAQATTVLLVLHLMQVVLDGAYKAPREVNFWFGFALLGLVLALSLTGYLLPWDQKGYWATKVATSIAGITPILGPSIQKVLVGGAEYGHLTLTRFFALHAGVLPALIIALIVGHIYLFRRHGITVKEPKKGPDGMFWPDQVLRDAVAAMAIMATVLILVIVRGGAELGAPADPTEPYPAARPEWYFMFLFQWLKYFPAGWEVMGAMVIPGILTAVVAAMPIIANWKQGHRFNVAFLSVMIAGIGVLTWQAYAEDAADPDFAVAKEQAHAEALRIRELAGSETGIPPLGALSILRTDALTQGPRIFANNCASCHLYDGHNGLGVVPVEDPSAADLHGFGSRAWLAGLLDPERVGTAEYFGGTAFARGSMTRFVTRVVNSYDDEMKGNLQKVIHLVSAEAGLTAQEELDRAAEGEFAEALEWMQTEPINCTRCHIFQGIVPERPDGPDLTGWGSREWMIGLIQNPSHPRFYGDDNDRMPAFKDDGVLTDEQIGMVVDWIRGDWYRPIPAGQR